MSTEVAPFTAPIVPACLHKEVEHKHKRTLIVARFI